MPVSTQTIGQIRSHLRSFETACAEKDIPRLTALLHKDVHGFGPFQGDAFSSRDELLAVLMDRFSKNTTFFVSLSQERIDADGVVAWVSAGCLVTACAREVPGRMTIVFRGTGHAWAIAQLHISAAVPGTSQ